MSLSPTETISLYEVITSGFVDYCMLVSVSIVNSNFEIVISLLKDWENY